MENTRRPYERTLSKEPATKKPRLANDQAAANRSSNLRSPYMQRQVPSNTGGGARIVRDRDSDSSDARQPSQVQQSQLPHLELVSQYKSALSELNFNSKPIITNLTIIAGENLHAAKAIASTVCIHILEVPKEQKLPSLYLLDSIVKNIGRDYIKYFATRLPEVFCKAYRQVDPSIHQGMRHLFGTWRGVFPPEPLHIIQKELGFTNSANGPSLGMTTSRTDVQTQRPSGHAHGIHVNPKYLEARGSASEISEDLVSSHEVEAPRRPTSNKIHQKNQGMKVFSAGDKKVSSMPYLDSEYGSGLSTRPMVGAVRAKEKNKERELDRTWYESGSEIAVKNLSNEMNGFGIKHGIENYTEHPSIKRPSVVSRSWKNSEEEEYAWDDIKTKAINHGAAQAADSLFKNDWNSDDYEKEDLSSYLQRPLRISGRELNIYNDAEVDFSSARTDPEVSEAQSQFKKAVDYSDGYLSSHESSKIGRTPYQSKLRPSPNGSQNLSVSRAMMSGPRDNVKQKRQMNSAIPSSILSAKKQRSTSPLSERNVTQQPSKSVHSNRTSYGPPTDPRKPSVSTGSHEEFFQNSLPSSPRKVQQSNARSAKLQNVQPSRMSASQQRKHVLSTQIRKPEVSELRISSDAQNLISSQVLRSGSHSNLESSSSGHSKSFTVDSPARSINSSFVAAAKTTMVDIPSPVSSSSKAIFQEVGLADEVEPASFSGHDASFLDSFGVEEIPGVISSSSNQVSSLLSSLVENGLISGSKSESPFSSSTQKQSQLLFSGSTSMPDSSIQASRVDPLLSVPTDPSSSMLPDEDYSDKAISVLPQSTSEVKNLIGFDFKPDVIRTLHPNVLADLFSDLSHKCVTCGLRLNLYDSVSKHMEWHAFREQSSLTINSRTWYKSLLDWFSVIDHESPLNMEEEPALKSEYIEHMVPADESQIACILCGELFEDFYCLERDKWMFKEAVYLNIPILDSSDEPSTSTRKSDIKGPIVHVNCKPEDFIQNLRFLSNAKQGP